MLSIATRSRSAAARYKSLEAFHHALSLEAHVLSDHPGLLWQQLFNRLQRADGLHRDALVHERQRRSTSEGPSWIALRSAVAESPALVRTIGQGVVPDGAEFTSCSISRDGTLLMSSLGRQIYLYDATTGRLLISIHDSTAGFDNRNCCAISPDGKLILHARSSMRGGVFKLRLWDADTGEDRGTLDGDTAAVLACAFSPDQTIIVSAGWDKVLKVWDTQSGRCVTTMATDMHSGGRGCSFSPDGSKLAMAGDSWAIRIWNTTTWQEQAVIPKTGLPIRTGPPRGIGINACAWHPDGIFLATGGSDGILALWDMRTETLVHSVDVGTRVNACTFSPNGKVLATGCADRSLQLWDVSSGKLLAKLVGHVQDVKACAFTPDGATIISGSDDNTFKVWDVNAAVASAQVPAGHTGKISALQFTADGETYVSASYDNSLKLWETKSARVRATLTGHTESINACAYSPDGSLVVSGSRDSTLRIWDAHSGGRKAVLAGHTTSVEACAWSPDASVIVSGAAMGDGTLKFWDARSYTELATRTDHDRGVKVCAISPDGSIVASAGGDGSLRLWNARDSSALAKLAEDEYFPEGCVFTPDGRALVSYGSESIRIWDLISGLQSASISCEPRSTFPHVVCAVSPDGATILSAGDWDYTLRLSELPTGRLCTTLAGHANRVETCAWTPDGSRCVSVGWDRALMVWDIANEHVSAMIPLPDRPTCLAVHPWQPQIAVGTITGQVLLLDLVNCSYGALIVTPIDRCRGTFVRCPRCLHVLTLSPDKLGATVRCPRRGCATPMRVNPFAIRMPSAALLDRTTHYTWWPFGKRR